jgi:hypothetical protein
MNGVANSAGFGGADVPPKLAERRDWRSHLFSLGVLAMAAACAVLFLFNPSHYRFYPVCLFHQTTGLLCPGCGSLRAMHQLLHGHLGAALHCNALLVASLPFAAWLTIRFAAGKMKGQPAALIVPPNGFWLFLAAAVAFGVLRNLPAFSWLAP